ncbi:MAG TPA: BLUF domain-containing protein [Hyphomicrobiaceae bacterium]|nr:BLUF domain-containing protein [Hyphomicrobiaceae bacterium]
MLVRCIYASRVASKLSASELQALAAQARRKNLAVGITGILCWTNDVFVQVLEGGRDPVCDLYTKILADKRHDHVRLMSFEDIEARSFGNWSMGHIDLKSVNPGIIMKYSETMNLDPFRITGRAMYAILQDLLSGGAIAISEGRD